MTRFLVSSLVVSLVACGTPERVANTNTLHLGNGGEPKSLDPHLVTGDVEHRVIGAFLEGLTSLDLATMDVIPATAESWTVSDAGTVYTFTIRDTARWSNGDPVTAHDFVYAWRRILSPGLAAEYAYMLYPIANAEEYHAGRITDFGEVGARAIDDRTLEVTLRAATPYFLTLHAHFTWYPVHRATIEAYGRIDERDTPWTRAGR
jgi:oligopeptide transport system substrate-binding protein